MVNTEPTVSNSGAPQLLSLSLTTPPTQRIQQHNHQPSTALTLQQQPPLFITYHEIIPRTSTVHYPTLDNSGCHSMLFVSRCRETLLLGKEGGQVVGIMGGDVNQIYRRPSYQFCRRFIAGTPDRLTSY